MRALAPGRRLGLLLIVALLGFGLLGPWLAGADPAHQILADSLAPPGTDYWLGADHLGRSMLARLAHATRLSLLLAAVTVASAAIPGTLLGILAAWRGGWVEGGLVLAADAVLALPGLLLVLLLAAFAPGEFLPLYLGLALAGWVEYFRVARAMASGLLARPHVEAARLLGFGPGYVLWRLLLPGLLPTLGVLAAFGMGSAVLAISTLSFIGLGIHPPTAELGSMTTELLPYAYEAPLMVLMPAALVFMAVLGCHLLAGQARG
ncbi:ABC transporter permease [Belnapia sp. T18]|uniref:ABC transporter permease n=1 Tax=Belnapia arida TaxID=2804533 RepID=A0ABS1U5S5_9PROT|nr:ABC transporter permease [Belnapia arida]MBL6080057.1 ABC transporter permease [Belnapia arida]